jgi:uncharacterized membrane protein YidH (DUF202 family)
MKDNGFKSDITGGEDADQQQEVDTIEMTEAKKKKKMAKTERKKAREELAGFKKENEINKSRINLEKLQLGWIKWNLTCIGLGFGAYKFYYSRVHDEKSLVNYEITGKDIGIFLISLGFLTLLYASIQHKKNIEILKMQDKKMPYSLSLRLSYVILGLSIIVLLMILLRA